MGLLQRIKLDLKAGWATLRQGTAEAANRAMEESELLKLRLELRKIQDQLDQVHEDIGERTVRLTEQGSALDTIKTDREITSWIDEVRKLRDERARIEEEMNSIRSMG
jgi:predicted  nucleic acid-binding Zn-ribbon protein